MAGILQGKPVGKMRKRASMLARKRTPCKQGVEVGKNHSVTKKGGLFRLHGVRQLPENAKPFTKTFIYGSWDGQFIFDEPMITKAYLAAATDETISIPVAGKYSPAGYYPAAYRITHDVKAKEYRVALTQLALRR